MNKPKHIAILGGGLSGLAAGYFAKKNGLPFTIYEAGSQVGGNAVTLKHGDFRFDSGAHRFHDKDHTITGELKNLLGKELKKVDVPSCIYHNGKFISFPLSPLDLLKKIGIINIAKASLELIGAKIKLGGENQNDTFEALAHKKYGKTISQLFLLNYSEKLWGLPCDRLSPTISGKRMKGLDVKTFLKEAFMGKRAKTEHLDGSFFYPREGFGTIADSLAGFCGAESIRRNARVTRLFHDGRRITALEIDGKSLVETDFVVNTLALSQFIQFMMPLPAKEMLNLANDLRFRNVIVVALFLEKDSITKAGSIYFPDPRFLFTRVYEPKNRSAFMSPPGKTSLCAEIPCFPGSEQWDMATEELIERVSLEFIKLGWIKKKDIIGSETTRLHQAYPVLERGFEEKILSLNAFLQSFVNLRMTGRNGSFTYVHVHDLLRSGKNIIEELTPLVHSQNESLLLMPSPG